MAVAVQWLPCAFALCVSEQGSLVGFAELLAHQLRYEISRQSFPQLPDQIASSVFCNLEMSGARDGIQQVQVVGEYTILE